MDTSEKTEISLTPLLHATSGNLLTIGKMRGLLLRSVTYQLCWGWHSAQRSDLVQKPPSSLEKTGSESRERSFCTSSLIPHVFIGLSNHMFPLSNATVQSESDA